jgi:hypothetical protein
MEAVPVTMPAVIHVEVPKLETPQGIAGRARGMMDTVSNSFSSWKQKVVDLLPKNFSVWLIALTCLIVLVAVSRILTLQKSVTELQSRPVVDENVIRVAVRKHLEETVKAMEQHNKAQAMARQAAEDARVAELQRQTAEQNRQLELQRLELQAAEARAAEARAAEARASEVRAAEARAAEASVTGALKPMTKEVKAEVKETLKEEHAELKEELDEEEKPAERKKKKNVI